MTVLLEYLDLDLKIYKLIIGTSLHYTVTTEVPCVFQCTGKISRKIYTVVNFFYCMHAYISEQQLLASTGFGPFGAPNKVGSKAKCPPFWQPWIWHMHTNLHTLLFNRFSDETILQWHPIYCTHIHNSYLCSMIHLGMYQKFQLPFLNTFYFQLCIPSDGEKRWDHNMQLHYKCCFFQTSSQICLDIFGKCVQLLVTYLYSSKQLQAWPGYFPATQFRYIVIIWVHVVYTIKINSRLLVIRTETNSMNIFYSLVKKYLHSFIYSLNIC